MTRLSRPTRDWLNATIDYVKHTVSPVSTGQVAATVHEHVVKIAESGDTGAEQVLYIVTRKGFERFCHARIDQTDRCTMTYNGQPLNLAARSGVRERKPDGRPGGMFQLPLWWEMEWDQFTMHVTALERQEEALTARLIRFRGVQTLREQFPDTQTPGEACEAAGIDPEDIHIEDAV